MGADDLVTFLEVAEVIPLLHGAHIGRPEWSNGLSEETIQTAKTVASSVQWDVESSNGSALATVFPLQFGRQEVELVIEAPIRVSLGDLAEWLQELRGDPVRWEVPPVFQPHRVLVRELSDRIRLAIGSPQRAAANEKKKHLLNKVQVVITRALSTVPCRLPVAEEQDVIFCTDDDRAVVQQSVTSEGSPPSLISNSAADAVGKIVARLLSR